MTDHTERDLRQRLSAAKAAKDSARAEHKAAVDQLRWYEKNRVRINSDALDLLLQRADHGLAESIERARSEAADALREQQRAQTSKARESVANASIQQQSHVVSRGSGTVAGAPVSQQDQPGGGV